MLPRRRFHPEDQFSIGLPTNTSHALSVGRMTFIGGQVDLNMEADFVSRKALTRIKQEGVAQLLVGVELDGPPLRLEDVVRSAVNGGRAIGPSRCSPTVSARRPRSTRRSMSIWK